MWALNVLVYVSRPFEFKAKISNIFEANSRKWRHVILRQCEWNMNFLISISNISVITDMFSVNDTILISFSASKNIQKALSKFCFIKKSNFFYYLINSPFFHRKTDANQTINWLWPTNLIKFNPKTDVSGQ